MNALATFPPVGKLVLLLSSDQPGEIVAAASAIDRTLRVAGFDWFDLVKAIDIGGAALTAPSRKVERILEPITELDMARHCLGHLGELTDNEAAFIRSVLRLLAYGTALSPKQSRWLMAIFLACGGQP